MCEQLITEHWEYIQAMLETEYNDVEEDLSIDKEDYIKRIKFHYTTAFEHGYKHGKQG